MQKLRNLIQIKKKKIPHVGFNKVTTNHYKGLYKNLEN